MKYYPTLMRVLFVILVTTVLTGTELNAQETGNTPAPSEERIDLDALALAYGTCKFELAKYYFEHDSRKSVSSLELQKTERTFRELYVNIHAIYNTDPDLHDKFERKVKNARKQLPTCTRYQQILDANVNIGKGTGSKSQ